MSDSDSPRRPAAKRRAAALKTPAPATRDHHPARKSGKEQPASSRAPKTGLGVRPAGGSGKKAQPLPIHSVSFQVSPRPGVSQAQPKRSPLSSRSRPTVDVQGLDVMASAGAAGPLAGMALANSQDETASIRMMPTTISGGVPKVGGHSAASSTPRRPLVPAPM